MEAIAGIEEDPFANAIELDGHPGWWRVRFANAYRIVYQVSSKQRRVIIVRVRHRRDVYKGLEPFD